MTHDAIYFARVRIRRQSLVDKQLGALLADDRVDQHEEFQHGWANPQEVPKNTDMRRAKVSVDISQFGQQKHVEVGYQVGSITSQRSDAGVGILRHSLFVPRFQAPLHSQLTSMAFAPHVHIPIGQLRYMIWLWPIIPLFNMFLHLVPNPKHSFAS